jgi:putative membrane protein
MQTNYHRALLTCATVCFAVTGAAVAQTPAPGKSTSAQEMTKPKMAAKLSAADHKFARDAAAGGAAEVEMGKMASEKASNDKVKQFGQRMVTDHGKAGEELKTLAAGKNITIPDGPDAKSKAVMARMSKLSGAAFDKAYMQDMVKDHEKDVAEFQKEADSGSDSDLKKWAATTLPVLQEHLRMAKEALSAVNAGT